MLDLTSSEETLTLSKPIDMTSNVFNWEFNSGSSHHVLT